MDKLSSDARKARAAGMSYGQWKATQPIVKALPRKIPGGYRVQVCEHCGCEFMVSGERKRKFCSDDCRMRTYEKRQQQRRNEELSKPAPEQEPEIIPEIGELGDGYRLCAVCGRAYLKKPKAYKSKTCSVRCSREYGRIQSREKYRKARENEPKVKANCTVCGKEFIKTHFRQLTCCGECGVEHRKLLQKRWREKQRRLDK